MTGQQVWLNFDGINYSAAVWVNGAQVGTMRGAFIRGIFDITANVKPGKQAVVAVLVTPQPHPGIPHEHTLRDGMGKNGGITAIDGPTFLSHHRLGLDSRDSRPRHRHLAKGLSLRHRPGGGERPAGHDRSSLAQDRLGRRGRAGHRRECQRQAGQRRARRAPSKNISFEQPGRRWRRTASKL